MMTVAILLLAQVIISVDPRPCLDGFDAAKVGQEYAVSCPCACNQCTTYYIKLSATTRRATGGLSTTLVNCGGSHPVEKVR